MTTTLTLTYGSVTVDLNTTTRALAWGKYAPRAGKESDETVTETIDLIIRGANIAAVVASIRDVELALQNAKLSQGGRLFDRVYLNLTLTGQTAYRSRVLDGRANLDEKSLSLIEGSLCAKAQLSITRANWWETASPVTLQVTNRTGTGATGAVVNHQDSHATDDLYLEIAAAQITGNLPTPAIIEFKNTKNDANLIDRLFVGHFIAHGTAAPPSAGTLIFESTVTPDVSCSHGDYTAYAWADAAENSLNIWLFSCSDYRQRAYKLIMRLRGSTAYTDLFLKVKLQSGSLVLAETRWTLATTSTTLIDLGSLQIPPWRFGTYVGLSDLMTLNLVEKRASGAGSLEVDFIAAIPQDSWRVFEAAVGLAFDETLIDNPVNGTLATAYGAGSYKVTHIEREGEPVMLQPGVKNVLYFLHDITDGTSAIDRTATITVKCHPRQRTL